MGLDIRLTQAKDCATRIFLSQLYLENWGSAAGEDLFYQKLQEIPQQLSNFAGENLTNKFQWIDHHLCHAASAYFVSPYEEAAVLVVDGIGEFESTTLYKGIANKLVKIKSIDYPNSLGFFWEKLSEFLGFSEYDASKVMGLAAYGSPIPYYEKFKKFLILESGSFKIDHNILRFRVNDFGELEKILGKKRKHKRTT